MKILLTFFLLFFVLLVKSQDTIPKSDSSSNSGILKIFLNCDECDLAFMKQELPYLHYVRDRKLAEVQIIVTSQGTGSGGEQYSLQFLGLNEFEHMHDTLNFSLPPNYSNDEFRNKINQFVNPMPISCLIMLKVKLNNINNNIIFFQKMYMKGCDKYYNNLLAVR